MQVFYALHDRFPTRVWHRQSKLLHRAEADTRACIARQARVRLSGRVRRAGQRRLPGCGTGGRQLR